jgi:predicted  nucleic acid-binding Zn-ribbon protein
MAKRKPTPEYVEKLKVDLTQANLRLEKAKIDLYKWTGSGKLGEAEFEDARLRCLSETDTMTLLTREIARAEKELLVLPQLPFGE